MTRCRDSELILFQNTEVHRNTVERCLHMYIHTGKPPNGHIGNNTDADIVLSREVALAGRLKWTKIIRD